VEADDLEAARAALEQAAENFTKAAVDAGGALKELKSKIEAADSALELRAKLAAKIAKKETKRREGLERMAEEDARKDAERKAVLAVDQAKRDAAKAKQLRERLLVNQVCGGGGVLVRLSLGGGCVCAGGGGVGEVGAWGWRCV